MEIRIPQNWSEVTLRQGKGIFGLSTGLTENEYLKECYLVLTNNDLDKLPIEQVGKVKQEISTLLSTPITADMDYKFTIQGEDYYLEYDLNRISMLHFKEIEKSIELGVWQNVEYIISSVIRKKKSIQHKKKYTFFNKKPKVEVINYELEEFSIEDSTLRANILLDHLPFDRAQGVITFFLTIGLTYIKILTTSLTENQTQSTMH